MKIAQTAAYYLAFTLIGMNFALLGPTINNLAGHAGVDLADISVLPTASALGYLGGALLFGRVYDRMRGAPIMAASLLALAAIAATMPTLNSYALLIGAQLLLGFAAAGIDVGGNALLVWVHGKGVGPFMNGLHLMFGVGSFLSPLLVTASRSLLGDIHLAYWFVAAVAVPVALFNFRLPSPLQAHVAQAASAEGVTAVSTVNRGAFLSVLVLFFFLTVAGEAGMATWLFNYAKLYGANDVASDAITSGFWGAFTFGRLIAIPISLRVAPGRILVFNVMLCILGMVLMTVVGGIGAPLWVAVIVFGIGMAPLFATAISYAEQYIAISGSATGFFLAGASMSSITIPFLIGRNLETVGPQLLQIVMLVAMIAAFIALLAVYRVAGVAKQHQRLT
jgi:MFS transporter, FHS family, Na+ dependent glucose transporter 1